MICFSHVDKSFGSLPVLRDFSLSLGQGEQLCLIGPSGQGKSTVLNLAAGLLLPDRGSVSRATDRISYVFQEDRLLPWLSARQNVALVSGSEEAARWLCALGLGDFLDALPSSLSGGMARRVAIARALAYPADLYLFDEPFKGLDEQTLHAVLGVVKKAIFGKTALFVSHNPEELGLPTLLLPGIRPASQGGQG